MITAGRERQVLDNLNMTGHEKEAQSFHVRVIAETKPNLGFLKKIDYVEKTWATYDNNVRERS